MSPYLRLEENCSDHEFSLREDLMGLSMLALLISPWAVTGLVLAGLNFQFMTNELIACCALTIAVAMPQILRVLLPSSQTHTD